MVKALHVVGFVILGFGGFVCALNFYLTVIRYRLYRRAGRQAEYRNISGLPFLGSVAVIYSLISYQLPLWAWIAGIGLAALDTGGPHWFVASVIWHERKRERTSRREN